MNRIFRTGLASLMLSGVAFAAEAGAGAAAAPAAPVTETKTVIKQNGIKRPDAGSITGKLWDIADEISSAKNTAASRKEVVDRYMAEVPNANQATANTQYARWVTFHGVSALLRDQRASETKARREAADAEKAKAKEDAEAKKKAELEAAAADKQRKADEKTAKAAAIAEEKAAKKAEKEAEKQRKAEEAAAAKAAKEAEDAAKAEAAQVAANQTNAAA